jgi:hypothetical protein
MRIPRHCFERVAGPPCSGDRVVLPHRRERLPTRSDCGDDGFLHLRFKFAAFMADEKGLKEITQAKGASGIKPCLSCANIVGRCAAETVAGPYLLHLSSPNWRDFDRWSSSRFLEMAAMVRHVSRTRSRAEATAVERSCGLNYSDGFGLLWGNARTTARIPETIVWDSMHTLFASSGVANLECAEYVRAAVAAGIGLPMLNAFFSAFRSGGRKSLPRFDLEERHVGGEDGSGLKAFAGEIVALVPALVQFGRLVLVPRGVLLQQVKCMEYLFCIQSLLFSQDVQRSVQQLRALVVRHHILFAALYPSCIRPKLHYLHHVVDGIEAQQKHISCFATERKHKMPKAVASFAFRNFSVCIMVRCALAELDMLMNPTAVSPYSLQGKIKEKSTGKFADCLRTPVGVMTKKEFALADGIGVIFDHFGLSPTPAGPEFATPDDFFVMARKCVFVGPGRWRDNGGELSKLPLSLSWTRCASMQNGNEFLPVLPARM